MYHGDIATRQIREYVKVKGYEKKMQGKMVDPNTIADDGKREG